MTLQQLLTDSVGQIALVIGNGINRYDTSDKLNSWDAMLLDLWQKHTQDGSLAIPLGISLTEFYDALDLNRVDAQANLQKEFCELLNGWAAKEQHLRVVNWAKHHACPILTTNFDESLADAASLKLHHLQANHFTDFYPWSSYFSETPIASPKQAFAIWHINGVKRYARSIRLGLSHYMGSVERARTLIHKGKGRLFSESRGSDWNGCHTWLDCIFHRDLLFLGLGLDTAEIFLRWLLIERAKYFKAYPQRKRRAWYVYAGTEPAMGKRIFLRSVGCEVVKAQDYDELYASHTWEINAKKTSLKK